MVNPIKGLNERQLQQRRSQLVNLVGEERVVAAEQNLKKLLLQGNIYIRLREERLEYLLSQNRLDTVFDDRTADLGYLANRTDSEFQQFAYESDIDIAKRPVYGYVASAVSAEESGEVGFYNKTTALELKPEIKSANLDRITFTGDDSLVRLGEELEYYPSSIQNPNLASFVSLGEIQNPDWKNLPSRIDSIAEAQSLKELVEAKGGHNYFEVQIHGNPGLGLNDVERVILLSNNVPIGSVELRNISLPQLQQTVANRSSQESVTVALLEAAEQQGKQYTLEYEAFRELARQDPSLAGQPPELQVAQIAYEQNLSQPQILAIVHQSPQVQEWKETLPTAAVAQKIEELDADIEKLLSTLEADKTEETQADSQMQLAKTMLQADPDIVNSELAKSNIRLVETSEGMELQEIEDYSTIFTVGTASPESDGLDISHNLSIDNLDRLSQSLTEAMNVTDNNLNPTSNLNQQPKSKSDLEPDL